VEEAESDQKQGNSLWMSDPVALKLFLYCALAVFKKSTQLTLPSNDGKAFMPRTGECIGPYTLVTKLGSGTFGVVWLAERRTAITTTKVALKCPLDDDIDIATVKHEADLWAHASGHPNIVPIIEANIYDGRVAIVSEYAPGGTLAARMAQHPGQRMRVDAAAEMILGILAGLEHLHARNIIHRDLKPANILLQGDVPRLADFGISRILKTTSQSNNIAGTPVYMAPEAFNGMRSAQTDLWAVGVIFYQMLTGRLPYPPLDYAALVGAILTRDPELLPPSVPSSLQTVIHRALSKDLDQRYKTATEMRQALRQATRALQNEPTLTAATVRETATDQAIQTPTSQIPRAQSTNRVAGPEQQRPATSSSTGSTGVPAHYVYAMTAIIIALLGIGAAYLLQQQKSDPLSQVKSLGPDKPIEPATGPSPSASSKIVLPPPINAGAFETVESLVLNDQRLELMHLSGLSQDDLRRLRNTVYARHGRAFQTEDVQRYFNGRAWYSLRNEYSNADLTANDQANIKLIQSAEH
jgi:serine/threonine protein kinase